MRSLEDTIKYWKKKRDNYIEKVKEEYKIKEGRGMTEKRTTICPICNKEHVIDKYDFVDSCIGYFDMNNFAYEIEKWLKERMKKDDKTK